MVEVIKDTPQVFLLTEKDKSGLNSGRIVYLTVITIDIYLYCLIHNSWSVFEQNPDILIPVLLLWRDTMTKVTVIREGI